MPYNQVEVIHRSIPQADHTPVDSCVASSSAPSQSGSWDLGQCSFFARKCWHEFGRCKSAESKLLGDVVNLLSRGGRFLLARNHDLYLADPVSPVGGVDDDVDLSLAVGAALRLEAGEGGEDAARGQLPQVRLVRLVAREVAQPREYLVRARRLVVERHARTLHDGAHRVLHLPVSVPPSQPVVRPD